MLAMRLKAMPCSCGGARSGTMALAAITIPLSKPIRKRMASAKAKDGDDPNTICGSVQDARPSNTTFLRPNFGDSDSFPRGYELSSWPS